MTSECSTCNDAGMVLIESLGWTWCFCRLGRERMRDDEKARTA